MSLYKRFPKFYHRHVMRCFVRRYCRNTSICCSKHKKVVFSGIQPSGSLHLGNYYGAIKQWLDIQKDEGNQAIFSVVDLHAITHPQEPRQLRENIIGMVASLLACGIDPKKSILFQQSMVPEHAELAWILGCVTTMARLGHLPQYKEKSKSLKEIPLGLFTYPVLQSADILLYRATSVPVGEDQIQHVQLAQHLVRTFNNRFGPCFPEPKISIGNHSSLPKLKSLRDFTKKMSKSDPDQRSVISLSDDADTIRSKLKKALTDFTSAVEYDPENRPAVANLIVLHSQFSGKSPDEICKENVDVETAQYKMVVAEELIEFLQPIRNEMNRLMKCPEHLLHVLKDGSNKARSIASDTLRDVKNRMGLNV